MIKIECNGAGFVFVVGFLIYLGWWIRDSEWKLLWRRLTGVKPLHEKEIPR